MNKDNRMNVFLRIKQKGFTLIELLVVISIIALLLSIMMPALQKVKELATGVACLANQRTMAQGFHLYATDNTDQLVSANVWFMPSADERSSWVYPPMDETGAAKHSAPTVEYELNGIRAGEFWTYIDSVDAYHCPADKRGAQNVGFRSYSMVAGVGGTYAPMVAVDQDLTKMSQIRRPGDKYILVEELEKEPYGSGASWWNMGSWVINLHTNYWYDPVAAWHTGGCNLAYADGHADKFKWRDSRTTDWIEGGGAKESPSIDHNSPTINPDMEYMLRYFAYKK